jgi:hypothetical protein
MAKPKLWLVSVKNPSVRFEVLKYNTETQTATLIGSAKVKFEVHPFTKEKITKDGYTLEKEDA